MKSESGVVNSVPEHKPFVPAEQMIPEIGIVPLIVGALLGVLFGLTSLYLVLQVGMTVSASVPIAVLSITLFRAFKPLFGRNATILENNMVQTTGSAGESIAFGVGVTMPALLILGYNLEIMRVMLVAVLGGLLGVLMMIPLRRVFIVKQHGTLTYPEGVACADVLIVGEKGGASAGTVFTGFGLALVYSFLMKGFRLWKETAEKSFTFFKGGSVSLEANAALLGVGYVIGPRIACIMVGGGILASWVLIPMIKLFGEGLNEPLFPAEKLIRDMDLDAIWHDYVLYIGAGAVAAGGIISMFQSLPTIIHSVKAGLKDIAGERGSAPRGSERLVGPRTDRDLSMRLVIGGCIFLIVAICLAPMLGLYLNVIGALLILVFGFLFVTVSARLTGEIGSSSNPISGMTVATLLLTCMIFVLIGWTGEKYRLTALSIAAIVCISCSNGGTVAQCLKTGYIVGGTPRLQQIGILVGALTSALVIGYGLLWFNDTGTVYSRKDLPTAVVDVGRLSEREKVNGEYAASDSKEYLVLQARAGELSGIPHGKYLVDERGKICYLIDPGINGTRKERDDGTKITKYKAPKAFLMSTIVDGILTHRLPWSLVLLGVSIAIVLELAGVPSLPFAVGVYLPLSSSTPIFVGGMVRWIADKLARRTEAESEMSPGVLVSSGYIAGGVIGVILGIWLTLDPVRAARWNLGAEWLGSYAESDMVAMLPFCLLVAVLVLIGSRKSNGQSRH